jgi:hypothetical protein
VQISALIRRRKNRDSTLAFLGVQGGGLLPHFQWNWKADQRLIWG